MKGLVLDGGGVFGIGQAHILSQIDISKFDFFVGTSIGSVLAAGIATNALPQNEFPNFFHQHMPKIFKPNWFRKINIFTPKHNDIQLNKSLQCIFNSRQMGRVKKPLFITSVNLNTQSLKVFDIYNISDAVWPVWEVVRCSVAAPTYFEPWKGYCDGGIFANNPSMVAIAAASKVLNCKLEDIEICSIGTGRSNKNNAPQLWSSLHWGVWLIGALLDGAGSGMHDYFSRSLPIKRYLRIEFIRDQSWKMNNAKHMLVAEKAWMPKIEKNITEVTEFLNS